MGFLFIVIGLANNHKNLTGDEFLASFSLSMWWYTIGAALIMIGFVGLLDILWRPDFALHLTQQVFLLGLVCVGLFCISYYFGYLFLGANRLWVPVALFYGLSAMTLLYLNHYQQPIGLDVETGETNIIYANDLPEFGVVVRMAALLFVPPLLGMVAFISLYKRVPTPMQRWRILFLSATLLFMFASPFATRIIPIDIGLWAIVFTRVLVLAATLGLLLTYYPPKAIQKLSEPLPHEGQSNR